MRRVFKECGFKLWGDVNAGKVQAFLAVLRARGAGARTANCYLVAFKSFCAWMVRAGRASESPVHHLQRHNQRVDVRRRRRAMTNFELGALVNAAMAGGDEYGMPGAERAVLSISWRWKAGCAGRNCGPSRAGTLTLPENRQRSQSERRTANIGERTRCRSAPDMAARLKSFLKNCLDTASAFPHMPANRMGAKILQADLASARAAWIEAAHGAERQERAESDALTRVDRSGQVADFHGLRHSFITNLARAGVHPKTAQDLARHSDVNLTLSRYTHTVIADRSEALAGLPDLEALTAEALRATGTDDVDGARLCRHFAKSADKAGLHRTNLDSGRGYSKKHESPCDSKINRESQGLHAMAEDPGLEPGMPDPESGVLPLHQSSAQAGVYYNLRLAGVKADSGPGMRIFGGGFRLDEAKKILIVRNDRIGDVVLTLPMATAIRRRFPQAEVHFLLRRYTAPLAAGHPDVGKVVVVPDSLKDRAAYDRCLREIRTEKYDLAIVVHSKGDVARLVRDAKIPFRMGSGLRLHSWRYNVPVFQRRRQPKRHELDYNLDMIRGYVPVPAREEVEFRLRPDEKALLRVRRFLDERKIARYTIVHPGSGQSAVDLPLETFGKLMDAFEFPGEIIVTGTSDESALYRGLAAAAKRRLLDATGRFRSASLWR